MRRLFLLPATLLVLMGCAPCARAQDANKIIGQFIKATGGSKALSNAKTVSIEGAFVRASDGKTGAFTLDTKLPNRFYMEFLTGERPEIVSYNGKSAWSQTPSGEIVTLLGMDAVQMEAAGELANSHLQNLKKSKVGMAFVGHAQVNGKDSLQVELRTPKGVTTELYFDKATHLLLREVVPMPGGEQQIDLEEYTPESGIQVAHKIGIEWRNERYQIKITRVTVNGTIGEREFDFPKTSQVQLPDLKKLFEEIDANQKGVDKIKENYAGTRDEEETEYDNAGKVKKEEKREYTFFYLNGDEISTLVKKDGKALSNEDQNKENEKTRKEIENNQKEQAKKEAKEQKKKEENQSNDKDDPGIDDFLRACQFVNPRRERFRGRDVLVFDFEPNPEFKAHKLSEKVAQKLAGVVWVDEEARQVVRLEAHFLGDFRFAGGLLANLQKGSNFAFEQDFVNNEVWLPTLVEVHAGARFLLVKGIKINLEVRYSDYKRFNVETLNTIGKPKEATPAPDQKP